MNGVIRKAIKNGEILTFESRNQYGDLIFDRYTFNPETNNEQRGILNRLRSAGKRRFFFKARRDLDKAFEGHGNPISNCLYFNPLFENVEGKILIDAGCGDGADADIWADKGGHGIGYDLFPRKESIRAIKRTLYRSSDFKIQDICERWPNEDASVDTVICHAVLDLMNKKDRKFFYKEVARVLKKEDSICVMSWIRLVNGHQDWWSSETEMESMKKCGLDSYKHAGLIYAYPERLI